MSAERATRVVAALLPQLSARTAIVEMLACSPRLRTIAKRDPDPLLECQLTRAHVGARPLHRNFDLMTIETECLERSARFDGALRDREPIVCTPREGRVASGARDHYSARVMREVMTLAKSDEVLCGVLAALRNRDDVVLIAIT